MATGTLHTDLFSSLIADIKSYSGKDPLLPWLRGIKKMKESLPHNVLKDKLPRFLQKCAQTFESDRCYRNDLRYLRVWLQLMDYVDDPKSVLRSMEMNRIGTKRSLFYQAYALYYEKIKKFEEAEKMYHLGVQNHADPVDELQKSYEQFLSRMEKHKNKKMQCHKGRAGKRLMSARTEDNDKNVKPLKESNHVGKTACDSSMKNLHVLKCGPTERRSDDGKMFCSEDTVVVKFVDTATVGKSEAEDACHHGLVDPTINMKEAMNAINSMFREPIETAPHGRRSHKSQPKEDCSLKNGFQIFTDENLDDANKSCQDQKGVSLMQHGDRSQTHQPHQESFQIYIDDEASDDSGNRNYKNGKLEQSETQNLAEVSHSSAFVFPCPKDLPSDSSDDVDAEGSSQPKLREDTVVHRFVGSTILDEPKVENVCHHGLVDPTINLKEAMDDINNMFGKPIDFVKAKRPKKQDKAPPKKQDLDGFSILPDDDLECQQGQPLTKGSRKRDTDLFEPTMFTKEAMDDINKLFGMPLDF